MHLGLEGKVILVTGGTKGIGRSIVTGFLEEGAIVHFCSRTGLDVEAAQNKLSTDFPNAKAIGAVVDVSDPDQVRSWVTQCAEKSGPVDVVVSNVSSLALADTEANWHAMFQTDMMGTFHLIDAAMPYLVRTKGNIVSIASVSGRGIDFAAPSPYNSIKSAIISYTAQLAHSLAPKSIRANTVSPGNTYVEDGVWGNMKRSNPALYESQLSLNPMGRMGTGEEVANAVLFLASAKASFISGANLNVDGALCTGIQF
ncbi:3-ketoacyl-ACP reductase like protein [Pleurostoma richardsiae]|uniref:3-ketoacyl-ACP reductase like protein n=1 Tax=Pleurostoma richardsiae TaxID=41990 RepID=A0AA38S4N9_9PEZI|nr:3-ketoacyl-ACP reductase like protein [Pleurostoma richardsiae]